MIGGLLTAVLSVGVSSLHTPLPLSSKYYLAHQAEVDEYIRGVKAEAEQRRHEHETNNPQAVAFDAKMRAALAEKHKKEQP